jgi:LysR family pca operon transcriptional activator
LEIALERKLFDRVGRRLQLNAAGQVFQRHIGGALGDIERGQKAVQGTLEIRTKIAVGALPTSVNHLVPQAALELQETHPNCALRILTGPNWLLMSQLRDGSLDLVVGRMGAPDLMTGLTFAPLYPDDIVAVVRHDHPATGSVDANTLQVYPLMVPPKGAAISQFVQRYLISIGANTIAPQFESVSLSFARHILPASDTIWFISRGVVVDELAEGRMRLLPLDMPMMAGPVGISLRQDVILSPELTDLLASLKAVAGQMHPPD